MKLDARQGLGQSIGNHLIGGHVGELDPICRHLISNIPMLDVDMLGLGVEDRIVSQSHRSLFVIFQRNNNAWLF